MLSEEKLKNVRHFVVAIRVIHGHEVHLLEGVFGGQPWGVDLLLDKRQLLVLVLIMCAASLTLPGASLTFA